jgi:hypothetical protein
MQQALQPPSERTGNWSPEDGLGTDYSTIDVSSARVSRAGRIKAIMFAGLHRWREFLVLGIADAVLFGLCEAIPHYTQVIPGGVENNFEHLYPVKLGGKWCTAKALAECSALPAGLAATISDCCKNLLDGDLPYQQVSGTLLTFISFFLPAIILLLRRLFAKCKFTHHHSCVSSQCSHIYTSTVSSLFV